MSKTSFSILVVDDVPENIGVLLDILKADYRLLVAESAESCLEQLPHAQPDLILLDVKMPGMDGFELCRKLKASADWKDIPVIFMTAIDNPKDKHRALELGAVDYVTKPVYVPEVVARVQTHLNIIALQRELREQKEMLELEVLMRRETENQLQDSLEQAIVVSTLDGQIVFATDLARGLLHRYFSSSSFLMLPDDLIKAVGGWSQSFGAELLKVGHPAENNELSVEVFAGIKTPGTIMLQLHESNARNPSNLKKLGLSPRESEVLFWISEGKTYPEIATILGASVRTVHKHAENVFRKLNVESKSAAMRMAMDALG